VSTPFDRSTRAQPEPVAAPPGVGTWACSRRWPVGWLPGARRPRDHSIRQRRGAGRGQL